MKLENTFSIPVPPDDAWRILLDLERVAPCVPGATLTNRDGDDYHGKVKVKLGPISLTYHGVVKVVAADDQARITVLEGRGRETRGNGTATATITCRLAASDAGTDVFVDTELDITGKPAQFGRGALTEVSGALLTQFATNLAEEIGSAGTIDTPPETDAVTQSPPPSEPVAGRSAQPIDVLAAAGSPVLARLAPVAGAALLVMILLLLGRRNRRGPARNH